MDIYCSRCGEPWEQDSLHEEIDYRHPDKPWYVEEKPEGFSFQNDAGLWHNQKLYEEQYFSPMMREFRSKGCKTFTVYNGGESKWCDDHANKKNDVYGALMDFAGDDIDFAASMMEDAERMGLLEE